MDGEGGGREESIEAAVVDEKKDAAHVLVES